MSDKPAISTLPRWATGGSALVTNPTSGEKDNGWVPNERPPAQHENWLLMNIYLWLLWIANGYWTRNDPSDTTPVMAWTDAGGNEMTYVDNAGYFFGPAIEEVYRWRFDNAVGANTTADLVDDLRGTTAPNTVINAVATDTYNTNFVPLELTVQDAAAAATETVSIHRAGAAQAVNPTGTQNIHNVDDAVLCAEVLLQMSAVGANNVAVSFGFHESPKAGNVFTSNSSYNFAMLSKESSDTNWQCRVSQSDGSAASDVDSGTPPVANTMQALRVEYHGLNTPVGVDAGFAVARFFIDGTLEAEIGDARVPTEADLTNGLDLALAVGSTATGPTGDLDVVISPVKFAYNMVLDPYVPA